MVDKADVVRIAKELLRPAVGRIKGMIRRGTLGTLKTTSLLQSAQLGTTKDDTDEDVEVFEQFGFTSAPPVGSEGIVLRVGGERAGSVALCIGNRLFRLAGVGPSEVAMYDDKGASIVIRATGNIEVTPGPGGVVQLGGPAAILAVARATDPVSVSSAALLELKTAINGWAPVANDGGAALKAALATFLALSDTAVAAGDGTITAGGVGSTST